MKKYLYLFENGYFSSMHCIIVAERVLIYPKYDFWVSKILAKKLMWRQVWKQHEFLLIIINFSKFCSTFGKIIKYDKNWRKALFRLLSSYFSSLHGTLNPGLGVAVILLLLLNSTFVDCSEINDANYFHFL